MTSSDRDDDDDGRDRRIAREHAAARDRARERDGQAPRARSPRPSRTTGPAARRPARAPSVHTTANARGDRGARGRSRARRRASAATARRSAAATGRARRPRHAAAPTGRPWRPTATTSSADHRGGDHVDRHAIARRRHEDGRRDRGGFHDRSAVADLLRQCRYFLVPLRAAGACARPTSRTSRSRS